MSKQEFLLNVRRAKSLLGNQRMDSTSLDPAPGTAPARAALWLTPKSVEHFNAGDFPELGEKQAELHDAVLAFRKVATEVPRAEPAAPDQIGNGKVALERVLKIVAPYLPIHDEAESVEKVLKAIPYPEWVVNWDYELGSDEDGTPAVWLNVYADEDAAPRGQLGLAAARLTQELRKGLLKQKIDRWPYVRLLSGKEHMATK
jgi:hypothetical protein